MLMRLMRPMRRRCLNALAALLAIGGVAIAPLARAQTAPPPPPYQPYGQPYPQAQPYPQPYPAAPQPYAPYPPTYYPPPRVAYPPTYAPVYTRPVRSGPSPATVAGAVLATTGGLFLISGFIVYVQGASSASVGDYERTLDRYAREADKELGRQRIGLGLLGSGAILLTVGLVTAIVGGSVERSRLARTLKGTDLVIGPNGAALKGRF
jgi:hypothetical protein